MRRNPPSWQQEQEWQATGGRDGASAPEVRTTSASRIQNFSQLIQPDSTPVSGDYQYKSSYSVTIHAESKWKNKIDKQAMAEIAI